MHFVIRQIDFREIPTLRYSFWLKLIFIGLELALAIAFGTTSMTGASNTAAVLEWTLGFGFSFYGSLRLSSPSLSFQTLPSQS